MSGIKKLYLTKARSVTKSERVKQLSTKPLENVDTLVQERFVEFRRKVVQSFSEQHPHIFSIMQTVFANRHMKAGMQVTENGQIIGEYTIHADGVHISHVESGVLSSEIQHPFLGVVKPYLVIERNSLENILNDEATFMNNIFSAIPKYLPDMTIKFLR
jgi:hypothetical protein